MQERLSSAKVRAKADEVEATFSNLSRNLYESSTRKNCPCCASRHSQTEACSKQLPRARTNLRMRKPSIESMDVIKEYQLPPQKKQSMSTTQTSFFKPASVKKFVDERRVDAS